MFYVIVYNYFYLFLQMVVNVKYLWIGHLLDARTAAKSVENPAYMSDFRQSYC